MKTKNNSWDPIWEKVFRENEWGKYPGESLIRFIARNYYKEKRNTVKLLEIGCGPGANIWYMAREGFDVTGIDGSETAIKKAKERLQGEGLNARLVRGDIVKLPFADNEFNGVIDNECLYANSEENTLMALSEINRVSRGGGLFYSRTFSNEMFIGNNSDKTNYEFSNIMDGPLSGKGFVRLMDKKKIYDLYGKFFDIISIDQLEHTQYNGEQKISEFIIVCQKK